MTNSTPIVSPTIGADGRPVEPVRGFTPEQIAGIEAEFGCEEDGDICHVRAESFALLFRKPKPVEFQRFKAVTSKEDNPARPEAQAQMAAACVVGVWDRPKKRDASKTRCTLFTEHGPEAVKQAFVALKTRLPGIVDQDAVTKLFRRMLTGEAEEAGKD